jgi:hypothetical protein
MRPREEEPWSHVRQCSFRNYSPKSTFTPCRLVSQPFSKKDLACPHCLTSLNLTCAPCSRGQRCVHQETIRRSISMYHKRTRLKISVNLKCVLLTGAFARQKRRRLTICWVCACKTQMLRDSCWSILLHQASNTHKQKTVHISLLRITFVP